MSSSDASYNWVVRTREWWTDLRITTQKVKKLNRALRLCTTPYTFPFAYDLVAPLIADGPKGYLVVDPGWIRMLHQRAVEHVTLAQRALSYDALYEVVSGTEPCPLYLDIEVGLPRFPGRCVSVRRPAEARQR